LTSRRLIKKWLAKNVKPCIERLYAVPKSASAAPGQRPTVQTHYNSLKVGNLEIFKFEKITIIDDVLTKGSTVFACAMRLHEAFPNSSIKVFSHMQTQGLIPEILKVKDHSVGDITYNGHDTLREP